MKLRITETIGNVVEVEQRVTVLNIYPFDLSVGAIQKSLFDAAGQIVYSTAPGTVDNLVAGNEGDKLKMRSGLPVWETDAEGATTITAIAGETLAANNCVVIAVYGSASWTAGRAYKADAGKVYASTSGWVAGFVTAAANAGDTVTIQEAGKRSGFAGMTAGKVEYVSTTPGGITETAPTNAQPVGIALSASEILINIRGATTSVAPQTYYGYFLGGATGATNQVATADRIVFSTGVTAANTVSNLSLARYGPGSVSDKSLYGYVAGGYSTGFTAVTDRITYSSGVTAANTASNLSAARQYSVGVSDGITYGYFMGGYTGANVATADRITFATGVTAANTGSNLSAARHGGGGVSDGATYGYATGGLTSVPVVTADRITFATSVTAANTVSNLSVGRSYLCGLSDPTTYGYFTGGYSGSTVYLATTDRITYASGVTAANTASNLSAGRYGTANVSDGSLYGYMAGGYTGAVLATTDRITFATGVTAANTTSNLSAAKYSAIGLSDYAV